jgi:hypothetical protein
MRSLDAPLGPAPTGSAKRPVQTEPSTHCGHHGTQTSSIEAMIVVSLRSEGSETDDAARVALISAQLGR